MKKMKQYRYYCAWCVTEIVSELDHVPDHCVICNSPNITLRHK